MKKELLDLKKNFLQLLLAPKENQFGIDWFSKRSFFYATIN